MSVVHCELALLWHLDEERLHLESFDQLLHVAVGWGGLDTGGGSEDVREQVNVADGNHEDAGPCERPMDRQPDVLWVGQGLIPGG